jgi:Ca2+-binding EF-hand superfamily protein
MKAEGLVLMVVCLMALGLCYSEEKVNHHFEDYDSNGDGKLERMEYVKIMQSEDLQDGLDYE